MTLERLLSIPFEDLLLTRAALSSDGRLVAVGHRQVSVFEGSGGKKISQHPFPSLLSEIRFHPRGRYLAVANIADNLPGTAGEIALYEPGREEPVFRAHPRLPVEALAFSHDGRLLLWASSRESSQEGAIAPCLSGLDLMTLGPLPEIPFPDLVPRSLAFRADGRSVTAFGQDVEGGVFQVEGALLAFHSFHAVRRAFPSGVLEGQTDLGTGCGVGLLSPEGSLLVVERVDFQREKRSVDLLRLETGVLATLLDLEESTLPFFAFGSSGEVLLCVKEDAESGQQTLRAWETDGLHLVGSASLGIEYHTIAYNSRRQLLCLVGGGRCDLFRLTL